MMNSNVILKGVVGSHALGIANENSDQDEMGIFVEDLRNIFTLHPEDHRIVRDRATGVRSEPGDTDLTLYSLRKFCYLALKGNPSILMFLFLPEYEVTTPTGKALLEIRDAFYSRHAAASFLGYLKAQKAKLKGERSPAVTRPELVEKYGYDTKFAAHAIRLGMQGIEYCTHGKMRLPLENTAKQSILSIRRGELSLEKVLEAIDAYCEQLAELKNSMRLWEPDTKTVENFLIKEQLKFYGFNT